MFNKSSRFLFIFNNICFKVLIYICLCRLNDLVDVITKNACGNTSSYLNFTLESAYCCVSYVSDVMILMAAPGELSNHLMDWFRIWYNPQIKNLKFFVVSSYLLQTLQAWVKDKHGEGGQSFVLFVKKKQTIFARARHSNIDHSVFVCKTLECFHFEWGMFYTLWLNVGSRATWTEIRVYVPCKIMGDLERIRGWISWVEELLFPRYLGTSVYPTTTFQLGLRMLFSEMHYEVLFHKEK